MSNDAQVSLISQEILSKRELSSAKRNRINDIIIRYILTFTASISIIIVFAQIIFLFREANPALSFLDFTGSIWDPTSVIPKYGLKPLLVGTLVVTLTAMLISIPIGISVAIFISEIIPPKFKVIFKGIVEILAGIPSVVYGFFGMKVLTVFLQNTFNKPTGQSALAGGILLSIMALPTIVSVAEDAMSVVPIHYREASVGLGATKWQTISKIVVPSASSGITTAIILGMGRAIGETMAVLMVTGNSALIPSPITDLWTRVRTITANLGIEIPETPFNTTHYYMLFFTVILLFMIIIVLNLAAEFIMKRLNEKFNPVLDGKRKKNQKKFNNRLSLKLNKFYTQTKLKFTPFSNFMRKNKAIFLNTGLEVFLYLILQSWMRWWIAGLVIFCLSMLIIFFKNLKSKIQQILAFILITLTFLLVFTVLFIIIGFIIIRGIAGLKVLGWEFFYGFPKDNLRAGGILPAILGTIYLVIGSILFAVPIGILAGIYLAEYSKTGGFAQLVRVAIDNLNGTPSIVFGMFGFVVFLILPQNSKSLFAGQITLALMILPTIIRTTEEAVRSIPSDIKQGSLALGATKWYTIKKVVLPSATPGIITGIILGMGRSSGETAPIMFTAATALAFTIPKKLNQPVMVLSYHLYFLLQHVPNSDNAANATALILLILVLVIYGGAMIIRGRIKGKNKSDFFY